MGGGGVDCEEGHISLATDPEELLAVRKQRTFCPECESLLLCLTRQPVPPADGRHIVPHTEVPDELEPEVMHEEVARELRQGRERRLGLCTCGGDSSASER